MKILKRNYGHRNLIIFLILSLIYLQAIHSLSVGQSFFSLNSIKIFCVNHYIIWILTAFAGFMVVKIKKYSDVILLMCLISIVGENFILLSGSFNKLNLILSFLYLLFAFYFYITWELEVTLAAFNPKFSMFDLEKESRFKIRATIFSSEDKNNGVDALVTNIDSTSCFLLISPGQDLKLNKSGKYYVNSVYENVKFCNNVRIVSAYDRGIGFVFEEAQDKRLSWSELYKVCLQRGIVT
jgi:hypothetical protein